MATIGRDGQYWLFGPVTVTKTDSYPAADPNSSNNNSNNTDPWVTRSSANGDSLDWGFFDEANYHSFNYRGERIDTHFNSALTTGTGTPSSWDDPANSNLGGLPSFLQGEGGTQTQDGPGDQGYGAMGLLAPNRALQLLTQQLDEQVLSALVEDVDFESSIYDMDSELRNRSVASAIGLMDPYLFDYLTNRASNGAFSVQTSGRCWCLGLWEAAAWFDVETNTLYVPASWTAEQAAQFMLEYGHKIDNPVGKRLLGELHTKGILRGDLGFDEYNQLLAQGLKATADHAEALIKQAIEMAPAGTFVVGAWIGNEEGALKGIFYVIRQKSAELIAVGSVGVLIGTVVVIKKGLSAAPKGFRIFQSEISVMTPSQVKHALLSRSYAGNTDWAYCIHNHHFYPIWLGGRDAGPLLQVRGFEHVTDLEPMLFAHMQKRIPAITERSTGHVQLLLTQGRVTQQQITEALFDFYKTRYPLLPDESIMDALLKGL